MDPVLNLMGTYERRRVPLKDGGYLSILEAFDQKGKEPVFSVVRLSKDQRIVGRMELVPAPPESGPEMKGKYLWAKPHYKGGIMERYEIKRVEDSIPSYLTVQGWVLEEYADALVKDS